LVFPHLHSIILLVTMQVKSWGNTNTYASIATQQTTELFSLLVHQMLHLMQKKAYGVIRSLLHKGKKDPLNHLSWVVEGLRSLESSFIFFKHF
jgi:hypothetical protein